MTLLEEYYNKFNEAKRLESRHGQVEFRVTCNFIEQCLSKIGAPNSEVKIMDIGAGTGRYSIEYAAKGYDVTAVELVKHNVQRLKRFAMDKNVSLNAYQGNALNLKRFKEETYDVTLLFGPMYHLFGKDNKIQALNEAKRITKKDGYILVAYCMNEYALLMHGFRGHNILECIENGKVDENYSVNNREEDLYDYVRISDIDLINHACGLERTMIISPEGPADYMRNFLNEMSEEEFERFIDFQLKNASRSDLIGAGSHVVDILKK